MATGNPKTSLSIVVVGHIDAVQLANTRVIRDCVGEIDDMWSFDLQIGLARSARFFDCQKFRYYSLLAMERLTAESACEGKASFQFAWVMDK